MPSARRTTGAGGASSCTHATPWSPTSSNRPRRRSRRRSSCASRQRWTDIGDALRSSGVRCRPDVMGTLSSELGSIVDASAGQPRVYADANVPNGVVGDMRQTLKWDVLFVLEHDNLRRARDIEHFRLARQLGRTLVTLDRDYLDERTFPPKEGAGGIVFCVPDERWLPRLLARVARELFRTPAAPALPPHRPNAGLP